MKVKSLAVLSMAAVSFLVGCNGDNSADKKFVDNINKVIENSKDKINTTYDAEVLLNDAGYSVENKLSNKQLKLAFDIDSKCFIAMEGSGAKYAPNGYNLNSNTYHLYQVTDYYDANSKYSQYLTSNFAGCDDLLVTTGIDTGRNKNIKNIQYYNPLGNNKDIYLNTFCDYLEVNAPNETIKHYGETNNIFILESSTKIDFKEYGEIAYIQTSAGDFTLEDDSSTDVFEIPEGCDVTVKQNENAHVMGAINAPSVATDAEIRYIEASTAAELKAAFENTSKNFIRLVGDIDTPYEMTNGFVIKRNLFLDLNGRNIKFVANTQDQITIGDDIDPYYYGILLENTEDNPYINCFILDTKSRIYEKSGITLDDCSFIVHGTQKGTTADVVLNIDSGKFNVEKHNVGKSAGVMVIGNTDITGKTSPDDSRDKFNASLGMYGGYMKTIRGEGSSPSDYSFKCIQPRGDGANVYMRYGNIESGNFCISTQGRANSNVYDRYGGYNILIEGGNLIGGTEAVETGDYEYTPLFFSADGYCRIEDCNVTGPTCINVKRGRLDINGGTYTATGNKDITQGGESGSVADGSVIVAEANKFYVKHQVSININNAVMTSQHKYITNVVPYTPIQTQLPDYPLLTINHNNGVFTYWKGGEGEYKGTGVKVADSLLSEPNVKCYADPKHGTWIDKQRGK